jgi:ubiquinone/menaquinone biosynthesis C-methylase UbiE
MKWTTRAFIQRVLSKTPGGEQVYHQGQFYFGQLRDFKVDSKVGLGRRLLKSLIKSGATIADRRTLEIGTGWAPTIPILFWLFRQRECDTYDISKILAPSLIIEAATQLVNHPISHELLADDQLRYEVEERKQELKMLIERGARGRDILKYCNIRYHAPADAANTNLANGSVDVVYSSTVLEHIPQPEIKKLFVESLRILRPGGHIVHLIDMNDHFTYTDQSISSINFLQFSEDAFSKYNSKFLYQNRLRASRWRQMIIDNGFEIVYWQPNTNHEALSTLSSFPLNEDFASMEAEDVCTTSVYVVAKKP